MLKLIKERIVIALIAVLFTVITSIPIYSYAAGSKNERIIYTIALVEKNTNKLELHCKTDQELKILIMKDLEVIKNDIKWIREELNKK